MVGLKAVFLKKLSMTAYAMGRYAITRRKIRAGAVVPKIQARRSVVALMPAAPPLPLTLPSPPEGERVEEGGNQHLKIHRAFAYLPCPGRGRTQRRTLPRPWAVGP